MRLRVKIAANTFVQILGKIISAGCTLLVTVLIARRFGVAGFGEFVKITTYVSLFYLVVDFGLNAVVLREIESAKRKAQSAKPQLKTQNYFGNLLALRVFFALILIFLALAILAFLPFNPLTLQGFTPLSKLGIIILAPTILTQAVFTSCNAVFQKNLRYDLSVSASSLGSLGSLGLVYLLLKRNSLCSFFRVCESDASLLFIVGSYLIGGAIMAIIALYLSGSFLPPLRERASAHSRSVLGLLNLWRRLFLKSLPLGLTLIFNLVYFKADTLILTIFRPTEEVGIYGLARSFFEFPLCVPTFFMNAVYPVLIQKTKNKKQKTKMKETELSEIVKKSALFLIISSFLLSVICYLLSPYIALIKPDFAPSILVFRILSFYLPIFFLSSLLMWMLIAFGKQRILFFIYGGVMTINIFLNLIFIPRFGYLAATIVLGISEVVVLGLTARFCLAFLRKKASQQR